MLFLVLLNVGSVVQQLHDIGGCLLLLIFGLVLDESIGCFVFELACVFVCCFCCRLGHSDLVQEGVQNQPQKVDILVQLG